MDKSLEIFWSNLDIGTNLIIMWCFKAFKYPNIPLLEMHFIEEKNGSLFWLIWMVESVCKLG